MYPTVVDVNTAPTQTERHFWGLKKRTVAVIHFFCRESSGITIIMCMHLMQLVVHVHTRCVRRVT